MSALERFHCSFICNRWFQFEQLILENKPCRTWFLATLMLTSDICLMSTNELILIALKKSERWNSWHWLAWQSDDFFSFITPFCMDEAEPWIPRLSYSSLCYITVAHEFKEMLMIYFDLWPSFELCMYKLCISISSLWNKFSAKKSGCSKLWRHFRAIGKYCTSARGFFIEEYLMSDD